MAVGPQDGGRHFTWEQAALCLWLPWSEAGDAGPQTQGRGRRAATPQLSLVRIDTQSVWSAHTGLSPGSPTVLVFWCPGQPRENRVRPSAAFWFPECSCHQQDQTLSSGPLPSQGTGGLLWILDPSQGCPREPSPLTWPGTVGGGTPLHTTSHVIPTLLAATFKWPWGPPPQDTRAQSSASDQSSSLDPGSSSPPNICTSRPLPRGPRLDTEFLTVRASVRESSKQRAKTIALRIQLFFIPRRRQTVTLGKTISAQGFVTQTAASPCFPVEFYVKEQHDFLARARHKSAE